MTFSVHRNKKHHYRELSQEAKQLYGRMPTEFADYWLSRYMSQNLPTRLFEDIPNYPCTLVCTVISVLCNDLTSWWPKGGNGKQKLILKYSTFISNVARGLFCGPFFRVVWSIGVPVIILLAVKAIRSKFFAYYILQYIFIILQR